MRKETSEIDASAVGIDVISPRTAETNKLTLLSKLKPLSGTFADPQTEREYRRSHLSGDARLAAAAMILMPAIGLIFIRSDYLLFGWGPELFRLLGIRLAILAFSAAMVWFVLRATSPRVLDTAALLWTIAHGTAVLTIDATRPGSLIGPALADCMTLLGFYLLLPFSRLRQLAVGIVFGTAGWIVNIVSKPDTPPLVANTALVGYLSFAGLGFLLILTLDLGRRRQFAAYAMERELRLALEKTHEKLQILRGLLPICASCKKIRDEDGHWWGMESFISEHSEASFSHGLCPNCAENMYPSLFDARDYNGQ